MQLARAAEIRPGCELDLQAGSWWIAVKGRRWWPIRVEVADGAGPPEDAHALGDDIPTNRELGGAKRAWPEPLPGARLRVLDYLDGTGEELRRHVLAYHYQDDLTGHVPASLRTEREIAEVFDVATRRVSDLREQLQAKIWGSRTGHIDDLRRYLIDEDVDALRAFDYLRNRPPDGTAHAQGRLRYVQRARKRNAAPPEGAPT